MPSGSGGLGAGADGLVYQPPADGAWAEYDLHLRIKAADGDGLRRRVDEEAAGGRRVVLVATTPEPLGDPSAMDQAAGPPSGLRPVAFVRLCGMQGKHVDVGFRFVEPGPQHQDVVANLRNYLFNPR